ncbi:MAG: GTPase Era [Myxococcota bacterium]
MSEGRRRSSGRGRGPRGSNASQDREKLARARKARKAEKRREAEAKRQVEAEEHARRRATWERPRLAVEPPIEAAEEEGPFRAGWVALVGRPNVGKSTLLNALLGQKLAATTHKPQTTRKNLIGVLNPPGAQILLLDTPGHHQAKGPLNRFMVAQAEEAVREADVVVFVAEARVDGRITPGNERLFEVLDKIDKPIIVALNKTDRVRDKQAILHQIGSLQERLGERLTAIVPISARARIDLEPLVQEVGRALPPSEPLLPVDEVTTESEREIISEFIREKAMLELQDELPYSVAVTIDRFEDLRPKLARIFATLHVERPSQKGIVIGKQGSRLKVIGSRARKDIEYLLGSKCYLDLSVRVTGDWSSDGRRLRELGYTKRDAESPGASAAEVAEALASLPEEVLQALEAEDEGEET